jgi:hypothetical protein
MLDLPQPTHRGLIEPISGKPHLKRVLLKRFLLMIEQIRKSKKPDLQMLLRLCEKNTNSTTGKNLRNIMLITKKQVIEDINSEDINSFPYFPRPDEDEWKLEMLEYLVEERNSGGLDESQVEWLEFLCID